MTAPMTDVDVAILGAGSAGLSAYRAAARRTDRLLLIASGPAGNTCARVGCMPSKLLIAAAEAAHRAREAGPFGVRVGAVQVDGHAVMERVKRVRDYFVQHAENELQEVPQRHRLLGCARIVSPGVMRDWKSTSKEKIRTSWSMSGFGTCCSRAVS